MFKVRLTQENGAKAHAEFQEYNEMVVWIAKQPEAGIMVWEDGEDVGTEQFIQLQKDVEFLQD